jgi:uncharacterized SAM-binding protein YcdF (DUF218 family)
MKNPLDSITNFIFVEDEPQKADVILIPGGMRPQLMQKATELYRQGFAPYILPSGGVGRNLAKRIEAGDTEWSSEWEFLKNIAVENGVPESAILKEDKSVHTFNNANLSWEVLQNNKIKVNKVILACKAYHSRRALMTYKTVFPKEIEFIVCPVIDDQNVRKDNWFLNEEKIKIVMQEVEKIGQYFGKHIHNWI